MARRKAETRSVPEKRCAWFSTFANTPETIWTQKYLFMINAFWADIDTNGVYVKRTTGTCYSPTLLASMKANCTETFLSVGAPSYAAIHTILCDSAKITQFITDVLSDVREKNMTGIDIDWESQLAWTADDYTAFKGLVNTLGTILHAEGRKLQYSSAAYTLAQKPDNWDYADFNSLPLDYMTIRLYGNNASPASVGVPFSPFQYIIDKLSYIKPLATNYELIPALNNGGYYDTTGETLRTGNYTTFNDAEARPGWSGRSRDSLSGELQWTSGGNSYSYVDAGAMRLKESLLRRRFGFDKVAVWSIQTGSPYF